MSLFLASPILETNADELLPPPAAALLPNVGAPSPPAAAATLGLPALLPSTLPSMLAGLQVATEHLERRTSTTLVAEPRPPLPPLPLVSLAPSLLVY